MTLIPTEDIEMTDRDTAPPGRPETITIHETADPGSLWGVAKLLAVRLVERATARDELPSPVGFGVYPSPSEGVTAETFALPCVAGSDTPTLARGWVDVGRQIAADGRPPLAVGVVYCAVGPVVARAQAAGEAPVPAPGEPPTPNIVAAMVCPFLAPAAHGGWAALVPPAAAGGGFAVGDWAGESDAYKSWILAAVILGAVNEIKPMPPGLMAQAMASLVAAYRPGVEMVDHAGIGRREVDPATLTAPDVDFQEAVARLKAVARGHAAAARQVPPQLWLLLRDDDGSCVTVAEYALQGFGPDLAGRLAAIERIGQDAARSKYAVAAAFLMTEVWSARHVRGDDRKPSERPDRTEAVVIVGEAYAGRKRHLVQAEITRPAPDRVALGEWVDVPNADTRLVKAFWRGYAPGVSANLN